MLGAAHVGISGHHVTNGETEAQPLRLSEASQLGSLPTVKAQGGSFVKCIPSTYCSGEGEPSAHSPRWVGSRGPIGRSLGAEPSPAHGPRSV